MAIDESGLKLGLPNGVDADSQGLLEGFVVSVYIHSEYDGECNDQRRHYVMFTKLFFSILILLVMRYDLIGCSTILTSIIMLYWALYLRN